jgi:hypothetical protein
MLLRVVGMRGPEVSKYLHALTLRGKGLIKLLNYLILNTKKLRCFETSGAKNPVS